MAKKTDITEKNPAELTDLLAKKREELRVLRFSGVGARIKDTNDPKKVRADIARIMTELGKRSRAAKPTSTAPTA